MPHITSYFNIRHQLQALFSSKPRLFLKDMTLLLDLPSETHLQYLGYLSGGWLHERTLDMSALERPGRNHTENSTNPNVRTNIWRRTIRSSQTLSSSLIPLPLSSTQNYSYMTQGYGKMMSDSENSWIHRTTIAPFRVWSECLSRRL